MHPMKQWALGRVRPSEFLDVWHAGIQEVRVQNKGSVIQEVSRELLDLDESGIIKGRWRSLERNPNRRTIYMVRNGWFQIPILVLWRCSLAANYIWLGAENAWWALLGKEE